MSRVLWWIEFWVYIGAIGWVVSWLIGRLARLLHWRMT